MLYTHDAQTPTHTHTHAYTHTHTLTHTHRAKNSVKHFLARWNGSFSFSTVGNLIDHSEREPVTGGESGMSGVHLTMSIYSKLALICPL